MEGWMFSVGSVILIVSSVVALLFTLFKIRKSDMDELRRDIATKACREDIRNMEERMRGVEVALVALQTEVRIGFRSGGGLSAAD